MKELKEINIDLITKTINCEVIHIGYKKSAKWIIASGLMSDVLTTEHEEILLVTNLTSAQVVRTADMVNANIILFTNGKPISQDTLELIKEINITSLKTNLSVFEVCYYLGKLIFE